MGVATWWVWFTRDAPLLRYCEFLLVHYDISLQSARAAHAAILSSQLARLLNCTLLMDRVAPAGPTPSTPPTGRTPSSPSCEDYSDAARLSTELAGLSVTDLPSGEKRVCDLHPAHSLCESCSSVLWLSQTLRLVSIAGLNGGICNDGASPEHEVSHVRRVESILGTACDLLKERLESGGAIDLSPVGVPSLVKPPASVSKVKGHGRKVKKACMKVPSVRLMCLKGELACATAKCLLVKRRALLAQKLLTDALLDIASECRGVEFSLVLARLHYCLGVALAQQLEDEVEGVWFEDAEGPLHEQCTEEFMMCYQLCFPLMPTVLLRETCLWLSLLLAEPGHAHHFLSLSQHISLMHQTVLSLGKKLR